MPLEVKQNAQKVGYLFHESFKGFIADNAM
jgi:hypothetical protein